MRSLVLIISLGALMALLTRCGADKDVKDAESEWLNQNDTVQYVGMETCKLCHADKHATFVHTGMGLSFDKATRQKSAGIFDEHAIVYDSVNNFYYRPFWKDDHLMIMEFRLDGTDTIHQRTERIDYIIGSGQHTNSHMLQVNGYLYQAPITFYTQKKQWDLAPGMSGGFNSRFSRVIEAECMTCHNGLPDLVAGSVNKYSKVPSGIDCERCHGPGSLHIAQVSSGKLVDTARQTDYSIVNPRKLSTALQNQLCMRCHLQGVNVLHPGSSFFDFKPGDQISDHWNVFLPVYDGANDKFLMASQADRLLQSKCYITSQKISCITCHNPHLTVKETPREQFNAPCKQCHTPNTTTCKAPVAERNAIMDDCSSCHLPKSGSVDIPHVSISDHKIQIPGKESIKKEGTFQGLKCLTDAHPEPITMARGYLHYYESFTKDPSLLDSARYYIKKAGKMSDALRAVNIHLYYLTNDYDRIVAMAPEMDDVDAWTAYRIGEAYLGKAKFAEALTYFQYAVEQQPLNLDFLFKEATAFVFTGNVNAGEALYRKIIAENPQYEKAWNNLGVLLSARGDMQQAESCYINAIRLNPDYLIARLKLTELYIQSRQKSKARVELDYLERYYPAEKEVVMLGQKLRAI